MFKKRDRSIDQAKEMEVGQAISNLLSNEHVQESINEIKGHYISAIEQDSFTDKEVSLENCRKIQVLNEILSNLNNKIELGNQARKRLEANNGTK